MVAVKPWGSYRQQSCQKHNLLRGNHGVKPQELIRFSDERPVKNCFAMLHLTFKIPRCLIWPLKSHKTQQQRRYLFNFAFTMHWETQRREEEQHVFFIRRACSKSSGEGFVSWGSAGGNKNCSHKIVEIRWLVLKVIWSIYSFYTRRFVRAQVEE